MANREFDTRQFIDAMEKNGYRKANGSWIRLKNGKVTYACAGGQALLNLGVKPQHVLNASDCLNYDFSISFITLNDKTGATVTAIAQDLKESRWYTEPNPILIPEEYFGE